MPSHHLNLRWKIVNRTLRNKLQRNFYQNTNIFIHENYAFENVCKMAAILSKRRWVNSRFQQRIFPLKKSLMRWSLHDLYNLSYTVWLYIGSHFLYICMDCATFGFPNIFTETFQLWKPSDTKWHFTQFNAPHLNMSTAHQSSDGCPTGRHHNMIGKSCKNHPNYL